MLIKARCEYLENQGQIVQDPLKRLNEQLNENDNPVIILNYLKKDRFWDSGTDLLSQSTPARNTASESQNSKVPLNPENYIN